MYIYIYISCCCELKLDAASGSTADRKLGVITLRVNLAIVFKRDFRVLASVPEFCKLIQLNLNVGSNSFWTAGR